MAARYLVARDLVAREEIGGRGKRAGQIEIERHGEIERQSAREKEEIIFTESQKGQVCETV